MAHVYPGQGHLAPVNSAGAVSVEPFGKSLMIRCQNRKRVKIVNDGRITLMIPCWHWKEDSNVFLGTGVCGAMHKHPLMIHCWYWKVKCGAQASFSGS